MSHQKYDTAIFQRFSLSNGIPVYIQRPPISTDERCKITAFLATVGGCADPPAAPGTAHFREHLGLRGTASYPTRNDIERPFLAGGGLIRGGTTVQHTRYVMTSSADQLGETLPILGEVITNPRLDDDVLKMEKQRITDEFFRRGRDAEHNFSRHWLPAFFGNHPYGHSPIGTLSSVQAMSLVTIRNFQETYYHAGNLAIVAVGNLPTDQTLLDQLERAYGSMTPHGPFRVPPPRVTVATVIEVTDPAFGSDSLTIAHSMPRPDCRARHAWQALAGYLRHGIACADEHEAVEEMRNSIYSKVGCGFDVKPHVATFQLVARTQRQNFSTVQAAIQVVLERLSGSQFRVFQQRVQRQRKLRFLHPINADELVLDALAIGEEPLTIRQTEAMVDALEWQDLEACRQQLLTTEPFIFRALV